MEGSAYLWVFICLSPVPPTPTQCWASRSPLLILCMRSQPTLPLKDKGFGVVELQVTRACSSPVCRCRSRHGGYVLGTPSLQEILIILTAQSGTVKHRVMAGGYPVAMGSLSQTEPLSK